MWLERPTLCELFARATIVFARANCILSLTLGVGSSELLGELERRMFCKGSLERIYYRSSDH